MLKKMTEDLPADEKLKAVFSNPEKFRPYLSERQFRAGEFLNMDSLETILYIFVRGRFNVYGIEADGSQFLFRSCEAIMLIGENELLVKAYEDLNSMYQIAFSLEMLTDCTVLTLDYRRVIPDLLQDVRFLNVMCHSLVEKTLHFGRLEMNSTLLSADARVARYLLNTADKTGKVKGNQSIVAEQLRISYRHLHRVLKKYVESGYIARESGGYRIVDPDGLREMTRQ